MASEERANVYQIPKEMKASMQFMGFLTLADIGFLIGAVVFGMVFTNILGTTGILSIIVVVGHFIIGVILIHKPASNPDRRFISVLYSVLTKQDKEQYRAIDKHYYNEGAGEIHGSNRSENR